MKIKFERVKLQKIDTCLTYVLKRIGEYNPEKEYTLDLYDEYFDTKIFEDVSQLNVGDLIMWSAKEYFKPYSFEILENGVILTHNVLCGRHIAVVESVENDIVLFSECTRKNSDVGIPQLNMKQLSGMRMPDYILNFKK